MEILFPLNEFLREKNLPRSPLQYTQSRHEKDPLKTSVRFLITITICKQWS